MRAGKLNLRVSIQTRSESRDSHGGVVTTWTTIATRWGGMAGQKVDERQKAGRVDAVATHRLSMRYYSGLSPKDRLLLGSRAFNIIEILDPGERNREHLLLVKEDLA